jgi:hypothetical protein
MLPGLLAPAAAGLPWLAAKLLGAAQFILYRVAAWTGTLALYRKGRRSGKRYYKVLAVVVYALSWVMLAFASAGIWHWLTLRFAWLGLIGPWVSP